jgi:hypothetical protein
MEPFPTSVFKVILPLNICYYHQDLHSRAFHRNSHSYFHAPLTPSYTPRISLSGLVTVVGWSAIHFRGWFIRQVSHNTLLSGCRLSWPPPCCHNESTPFNLLARTWAPLLDVRFIPHRQFCLPKQAHYVRVFSRHCKMVNIVSPI